MGVDCGLARPRLTVQLNPSLDGLDDGHRPWIDLATGRTPPSMVRRRQLCVVHRQLHHAALVSVGDVLAAFCVPGPRHLSRWSLGSLPETVGLMRSCIVLVRQWEWDTWGVCPAGICPVSGSQWPPHAGHRVFIAYRLPVAIKNSTHVHNEALIVCCLCLATAY